MGGTADSYLGGLERLGYVLASLAALAALVTWTWRRFTFGWKQGSVNRRLNIEESRMLGYKQHLVVAEYEGRKLLLGVCPGRIDFLCRLDGGVEDFERLMSHPTQATQDVVSETAVVKGGE